MWPQVSTFDIFMEGNVTMSGNIQRKIMAT